MKTLEDIAQMCWDLLAIVGIAVAIAATTLYAWGYFGA